MQASSAGRVPVPRDGDHCGFPGAWEDFPDGRERRLLRGPRDWASLSHVTTTRAQLSAWSSRRYPAWAAAAALLITMAGVVVTAVALLQTAAAPGDYKDGLLTSISYAVPYGVTGAFLIVRRPDLPFGWLLSGAALLAAVGSAPAALYLAVSDGASQRLALVVYAMSATASCRCRAGPDQRAVPVRAAELTLRPGPGDRAYHRHRARAGGGCVQRLEADPDTPGLHRGADPQPAHRRDRGRPVRRGPVRRADRGAARPDRRAPRAPAGVEGQRYRALPAALAGVRVVLSLILFPFAVNEALPAVSTCSTACCS